MTYYRYMNSMHFNHLNTEFYELKHNFNSRIVTQKNTIFIELILRNLNIIFMTYILNLYKKKAEAKHQNILLRSYSKLYEWS